MVQISKKIIAVVGLGYVGLPLAVEFGKKFKTIGFDLNKERVSQLRKKIDKNSEISKKELSNSKKLYFSSLISEIKNADIYIIAVPTPINKKRSPDLRFIRKASIIISKLLKKGDYVIYESTVYPGLTEEYCVPVLEERSNLKLNKDFFVGYSPERINPGDKIHTFSNIPKIVSGSSEAALNFIYKLYSSVIKKKVYRVPSIKVAEAAKVIENSQRDLNVAFVNELAIIFDKMSIDTHEVLKAASTKWNFLNFKPGLVGGHCIGVDPYYLTYKANKLNYKSQVILSGRAVNSNMGIFIAQKFVKALMKLRTKRLKKVLIMGFTFKENCKDIRNTQVYEIYKYLVKKKLKVDIYDPWVDKITLFEEYNLRKLSNIKKHDYDGIILSVAHDKFLKMGKAKIKNLCKDNSVIFDIKSIFPDENSFIHL